MQQNESAPVFLLVNIALRIYGAYYCSNKAIKLNRNSSGWGVFGFLSPIIALIWISNKSPIINWEENAPLDSGNLKDENETNQESSIEVINEKKVIRSGPPKYIKSDQMYTNHNNLNSDTKKTKANPDIQTDYYEQKRPVLKKIDKSSDRY
jgi:hypothetical protein